MPAIFYYYLKFASKEIDPQWKLVQLQKLDVGVSSQT